MLMQDDWTPLHIAADNGHLEVIKHLLSVGAEKDKATKVSCFQAGSCVCARAHVNVRTHALNKYVQNVRTV